MAEENRPRPPTHTVSELRISFDSSAMGLFRQLADGLVNNARQLNRIERKLGTVLQNEEEIMASIETLETEVAAGTTVQGSAITLLTNLTTLIKAAGTDPAKLQAVVDQLTTNRAALAAAIVENTPAANEPPAVDPAPTGRNR